LILPHYFVLKECPHVKKNTNDGLTWSSTGCFTAVAMSQQLYKTHSISVSRRVMIAEYFCIENDNRVEHQLTLALRASADTFFGAVAGSDKQRHTKNHYS